MKQVHLSLLFIGLSFLFLQSCDKVNATQGSVVSTKLEQAQPLIDAYKIGDKVNDFELKNVNGNLVSMANFPDADGFIIIFTCNTCPYSNMYEQRIIELDKEFSPNGWPVIAINPNDPDVQEGESFDDMQMHAKQKGFTFPYLYDEDHTEFSKWGAARTPHVFVVNKTQAGSILEYAGAIDDNARDESKVTVNYIAKTIESIKNGEVPEPRTTKAIGCTIKTK